MIFFCLCHHYQANLYETVHFGVHCSRAIKKYPLGHAWYIQHSSCETFEIGRNGERTEIQSRAGRKSSKSWIHFVPGVIRKDRCFEPPGPGAFVTFLFSLFSHLISLFGGYHRRASFPHPSNCALGRGGGGGDLQSSGCLIRKPTLPSMLPRGIFVK